MFVYSQYSQHPFAIFAIFIFTTSPDALPWTILQRILNKFGFLAKCEATAKSTKSMQHRHQVHQVNATLMQNHGQRMVTIEAYHSKFVPVSANQCDNLRNMDERANLSNWSRRHWLRSQPLRPQMQQLQPRRHATTISKQTGVATIARSIDTIAKEASNATTQQLRCNHQRSATFAKEAPRNAWGNTQTRTAT